MFEWNREGEGEGETDYSHTFFDALTGRRHLLHATLFKSSRS